MSNAQTFGLLVPCRNGAPFLPRLLTSVAAQTRPFDQFWLFDDGSDDSSAAIARQAGARVIRVEKSAGPSVGRNRLARACECTWLHFHDADDSMAPNYLERVAATVDDATDLVVCDMRWINESTGAVENCWRYDQTALSRHPASSLLLNTIGGINGLYRRSTFEACGGFDETLRFWEDMELNLRLFARGARCRVINEELVTAYRRATSYSNSHLAEVWSVKLGLMRKLLDGADPELRSTIAAEAENIAGRLAHLGIWRDVSHALQMCVQAGGDPPSSHDPVMRGLKRVLPRTWAYWLQHHRRARASQ